MHFHETPFSSLRGENLVVVLRYLIKLLKRSLYSVVLHSEVLEYYYSHSSNYTTISCKIYQIHIPSRFVATSVKIRV